MKLCLSQSLISCSPDIQRKVPAVTSPIVPSERRRPENQMEKYFETFVCDNFELFFKDILTENEHVTKK